MFYIAILTSLKSYIAISAAWYFQLLALAAGGGECPQIHANCGSFARCTVMTSGWKLFLVRLATVSPHHPLTSPRHHFHQNSRGLQQEMEQRQECTGI